MLIVRSFKRFNKPPEISFQHNTHLNVLVEDNAFINGLVQGVSPLAEGLKETNI